MRQFTKDDDMDTAEESHVDIGGERLRVMTRQHDPLLEEERRHDRVLMMLVPDYRGFDKDPVVRRSRGRVAGGPQNHEEPKAHSLKCRRYMKRVAIAHGLGACVPEPRASRHHRAHV